MLGHLTVAAAALLPLALSAPTPAKSESKRSSQLSCVQFQYGGPFSSFGQNGFIHLYSNVTYYDSSTQTTTYNETRLGLVNGTIQPCGECRTTELFGFEVCQGPDRKGYEGLGNSPSEFYGHLLYTNVDTPQCIGVADASSINGSALMVQPCEYDYDALGTSGQYWTMSSDTGPFEAMLISDPDGESRDVYGPNVNGTALLEFSAGAGKPFTYYGFKAPTF